MPDYVETYKDIKAEYGEKVQFLSVSVDNNDDNNAMNQFQDKYGADWPIGKNRDFIELFDALEVPKKVIVAPNGDIAYQHVGYTDPGELKKAVNDAVEGTYKASAISQTGGSIFGIGFIAALFGILTFFSPCSFPMLPGYISYYISSQSGKDETKKVSPIKGGIFAAMGIVAFFIIIGIFVAIAGAAIQSYLYILMPIVGFILFILGLLTLVGWDMFLERSIDLIKTPFRMIAASIRGKSETESTGTGGLFAYGFGYGAAASSCMAPAFIGVIFLGLATPLGWLGAVIVFIAYTAAIGVMMVTFSILAGRGAKILEKFVSSTDIVKRISGLLLLGAGIFVVWYSFWGYKLIGGFLSF
jgi:cytochrome c-type biogenesis protein